MNLVTINYLLAWFMLMVIAIANGLAREKLYGKLLPELVSHQLSTFLGIFLTGLFVWLLNLYLPIESSNQAWFIGCFWLFLTVAFEFGFGHYIIGHSWQRLLADYNILRGRIWIIFLIWICLLPFVIFKF
jgi:hypothetical protein